MSLKRYMHQAKFFRQETVVTVWFQRSGRDDPDLRRIDPRTYGPHMQVGNSIVSLRFDRLSDSPQHLVGRLHIEKHVTRQAEQSPGPANYERGADQSHEGVQPLLPKEFTEEEGKDRKDGGQGIRQHVKIGGTEVVVVVVAPTRCIAGMIPVVPPIPRRVGVLMFGILFLPPSALPIRRPVSAKNGQTYAVDDQAEYRNEDRLVESDSHR